MQSDIRITKTVPVALKRSAKEVDLGSVDWSVPAAMINEFVVAKMLDVSVQSLRRMRCLGRGPRFRKLNNYSIRYKVSDVLAWLENQPAGGGGRV